MDCRICGAPYCDIHSFGYESDEEEEEEEEESQEEDEEEDEHDDISSHIDISGKWKTCFDQKGFTITVLASQSGDTQRDPKRPRLNYSGKEFKVWSTGVVYMVGGLQCYDQQRFEGIVRFDRDCRFFPRGRGSMSSLSVLRPVACEARQACRISGLCRQVWDIRVEGTHTRFQRHWMYKRRVPCPIRKQAVVRAGLCFFAPYLDSRQCGEKS